MIKHINSGSANPSFIVASKLFVELCSHMQDIPTNSLGLTRTFPVLRGQLRQSSATSASLPCWTKQFQYYFILHYVACLWVILASNKSIKVWKNLKKIGRIGRYLLLWIKKWPCLSIKPNILRVVHFDARARNFWSVWSDILAKNKLEGREICIWKVLPGMFRDHLA